MMTNSKYRLTEKSASSSSLPNPLKNMIAAGKTRKNENASPRKKSTTETGTTMASTMRSEGVSAGRKKRQT